MARLEIRPRAAGPKKTWMGVEKVRSSKPLVGSLTCVAGFFLALTAAAGGAEITGVVRYDGPEPTRYALQMRADPKCEAIHGDTKVWSDAELVGQDGGLQNVFVYVKNPPAGQYTAPDAPARLEQKGCVYSPHVQGIRVDQTLEIVNADPTLHNVRSFAKQNRPFNLGQPSPGVREKTFSKPEKAVRIKCDVHSWMTSYIFVMEHPFFAVSDGSGSFSIADLPPGEYTLGAWHEVYGEQEKTVTVGDSTTVDFTFEKSAKSR